MNTGGNFRGGSKLVVSMRWNPSMGWGGEVSLSQKRAEQSQIKSRSRWVTKQETDMLEKECERIASILFEQEE